MNASKIELQPLQNIAALPSLDRRVMEDGWGFMETLETLGSMTPDELAKITGADVSFTHDWLHRQAANGTLEYSSRFQRFKLPCGR